MIIDNPIVSGSLNVQNNVTASNGLFTSNLTVEGTIYGAISGSSATASYVEYENVANKPTLVSSSAQLADDISGSFTSLSSSIASDRLKNTTDTLTGDLTVTGTLTAQDLVVQEITSSIIYSSGSNKFGNELSNSHNFTGSVNITGSLNVNGAEVGTGKLDETVFNAYTSSTDTRLDNLEATGSDQESRIDTLENFSSSLDATFATDADLNLVSASVDNILAATSSYALSASISGAFTSVSSSIAADIEDIIDGTTTVASSSYAFTASYALNAGGGTGVGFPFSGSAVITGSLEVSGSTISGSFIGDGSGLSGITVSSVNTVTSSFSSTGSVTILHSFNSKNVSVSVYDDNDILIIPQQVTLLDNNNVKIDFGGNTTGFAVLAKGGHLVSGSVPVPQLSTVTDSFSSTTSHTVTHNFGTKEVIVSVYENDELIIPDSITTPTTDTVTVSFPEAISGRVVVVKAGHIVSGSIPFSNLLDSPLISGSGAITASGHLVPSENETYDLGSPTKRWRDIYLSGSSIYLGNTVITEDNIVTTGSLSGSLPAGVISGSAQIATEISGAFTSVSSSFASGRLKNTTDTLTGDLTVTGTLTAQDLHVQEVTSSIIYSSGSNIFGNSTSDTQVLYGDVGIGTGSPSSLLHLYKSSGDTMINIQAVSAGDPGITFTSINNRTGNIFYSDGSTNAKLTYDHNDVSFKLYAHNTSTEDFVLNETTAYFPTQNVGIGETQPDSKLHVKGDMVTIEDPSGGFKMELSADSDPVTIMSDNLTGAAYGQIAFLAGNGSGANDITRMLINSSGNVGIGSASPSSTLDVQTNSSAGVARISADGNGAVYSANGDVQLYTNDAAYSTSIYAANKGNLLFRVQNDGNVGIGTTAPNAILHAGSTGTNAYSSTITKGSNMKGIVTTVASNTDDMVGIYFGTGATTEGTHWSGITGARSDNASHWGTQLNFYTHNNDVNALNDATQKMVIMGDGNVGIGTASPGATLSLGNAGGQRFYVYEGGSVRSGLGVDMSGSSRELSIFHSTSDGLNGNISFGYRFDSNGVYAERMRLTGAGKLGINVTSPTKTLDVDGTIRSRDSFNLSDGTTQIGGLFKYKDITGAGSDNSSVLFAETGLDLHFMTGGSATTRMKISSAGDVTLTNNLYLSGNTNTRVSGDGNGEVGINYSTANTSTYSLAVYEGTTRKFGVRKDGNLYIYPGSTYSQTYTYTSSWATSFQTVVPNGTLGGNKTYLIQVWTNSFGTPPYYASAGWIFNTSAGTNGGGQSNTIDVATATHVSSNAYWQYNITTAQNSSNGIAVKLVNGPSVSSIALFVRVTELSSF